MPESRQDFQNRWQENFEALGKQAISGDMEGAYQQALKLARADDRGEEPRLIGSEIRTTPRPSKFSLARFLKHIMSREKDNPPSRNDSAATKER